MIVIVDLLWFRVMDKGQHKVERNLVVRNNTKIILLAFFYDLANIPT